MRGELMYNTSEWFDEEPTLAYATSRVAPYMDYGMWSICIWQDHWIFALDPAMLLVVVFETWATFGTEYTLSDSSLLTDTVWTSTAGESDVREDQLLLAVGASHSCAEWSDAQ